MTESIPFVLNRRPIEEERLYYLIKISDLTMKRDAARALVTELSERCFKQSELLSKKASKE